MKSDMQEVKVKVPWWGATWECLKGSETQREPSDLKGITDKWEEEEAEAEAEEEG